jgi:phospholipase/carboxylesterase
MSRPGHPNSDPHGQRSVLSRGAEPESARGAVILIHGRGASAASMLSFAEEFFDPELRWIAPSAAGNVWYPYSFLEPHERNEPWLSSALGLIEEVLRSLEAAGIPSSKVALLGFSQGACLALEFAARHPRRYKGAIGLSGGLIGSEIDSSRYAGSLEGTPTFLGCSDIDPHIPVERVRQSAAILKNMDAEVTERIYPGTGHTVNRDEIKFIRELLIG